MSETRTETYRYPWRQVTGRTTVPRRDFTRDVSGRAHWFWYRTEDLECGHRLTVVGRKAAPAQRRRCRQCPKER